MWMERCDMPKLRSFATTILQTALLAFAVQAVAEDPYPNTWFRQIGTTDWDRGLGVSADGLGTVYIAGETTGSLGGDNAGNYDAFTSTFNAFGTPISSAQFGTSGNDFGTGIAADQLGNVFLTGYSGPNTPGYQGFIRKYNTSGTPQWSQLIGPGQTYSYGVAADGQGNAFVGGYTTGSLNVANAGGYDAYIAKYDTAGNAVWTRQFGTPGQDEAFGVATDGVGSVYIAGATQGALVGQNAGGFDAFVSKYSTAGNLQWTRQFGTSGDDFARSVAADRIGDVYVVGNTSGALGGPSNGQDDAFIGKYDASGNLQWTKQLGTAANDYAYGVAIDSRGNALVVGATQGSLGGPNAGGYDAFLSKYDAAGNLKWTRQFGTSGNDFANGISTDGFGNFYVTGSSPGFLSDPNDPWLAKFTVPNVLGDFDRDGQLTVSDIAAMMTALADLNQYKTPRGLLASDLLAIGDFDHDNQITNADLQMLLSALINSGATNMQGVPEPASILIVIAGVGGLLNSRFRRIYFAPNGCTFGRARL
jgi:Beta-propeller repeat